MYSRRLKVEEKENKRKALGFGFLTIAILLAMFFYGIPLLVKFSSFVYDLKKTNEPVESFDKTPPPPPHLENLPDFTKDDNVEVKGRTESGATVIITFNNQKTEVLSNSDGEFSHTFSLSDGDNILSAIAQDSSGNKSLSTDIYTIVLDKKAPDLEVTKPKDKEEFFGSKQKQTTVDGKTEKDAQVQINDRFVIVDSNGNFSLPITLNSGDNPINVKSQDKAGNITEVTLSVKYTP